MYCSNCLYKNEEGQSLCSKCGKKLKKHLSNKQLKSLESSITRRSIKKDAYHRQKDPLYIAYIIKKQGVIYNLELSQFDNTYDDSEFIKYLNQVEKSLTFTE